MIKWLEEDGKRNNFVSGINPQQRGLLDILKGNFADIYKQGLSDQEKKSRLARLTARAKTVLHLEESHQKDILSGRNSYVKNENYREIFDNLKTFCSTIVNKDTNQMVCGDDISVSSINTMNVIKKCKEYSVVLKKAYKKVVLKLNPDKRGDLDKWKKFNEAYTVIKEPCEIQ